MSKVTAKYQVTIPVKVRKELALKTEVASEIRIINKLPLVILGNIVTEGALIYSVDEILRVDFETSVRSAFFDFLPVIRRYNSEYIDRVCS